MVVGMHSRNDSRLFLRKETSFWGQLMLAGDVRTDVEFEDHSAAEPMLDHVSLPCTGNVMPMTLDFVRTQDIYKV
jgi:hypothetical protein